jgi:hypothetical protein
MHPTARLAILMLLLAACATGRLPAVSADEPALDAGNPAIQRHASATVSRACSCDVQVVKASDGEDVTRAIACTPTKVAVLASPSNKGSFH